MTERDKQFCEGWNAAMAEIPRQFRKQFSVEELNPEAKKFAEFVLKLCFRCYGDVEPTLRPLPTIEEERAAYLKSDFVVEGLDPFGTP